MKRLLKILLLLIVIIPLAYSLMFLTQNYSIKKSFESHIDGKIGDYNDNFIRCDWNILNIKIAYPFMDGEMGHVSFYKPGRIFWATSNDWDNARTGGTTVENTTFDELVAMVKEDCSQFQQSKGNHTDETINWSYSEYIPEPEPVELSPEQQAIKERWELGKELRLELSWMTEEDQKYVEEKYGITLYSSMDELLEWHKKAVEDGFFEY